jgi:hypothetical protein
MRKDELVNALAGVARRNGRRPDQQPPSHAANRCRLQPARQCDRRGPIRDQLVVDEVDDRWLRARWVLSERILERARVALGAEWPHAVPVLRVYDVTERNGAAANRVFVNDVEIRQEMDDWYLPVEHSGLSYRVELGYRTPQGSFFVLARSAKVRTPQLADRRAGCVPGGATIPDRRASGSGFTSDASDSTGGNGKTGGAQTGHSFPSSSLGTRWRNGSATGNEAVFEIEADIILHGRAHPRANLTLMGEPIRPHTDGTFAVRMALDDGRQVIPAVCVSPNGCHQRTILLAVERNTKHLNPMPTDDPA